MEGRKGFGLQKILEEFHKWGLVNLGTKKNVKEEDKEVEGYHFNPHKHVRIWFTPDENIFTTQENQLRLIRLRVNNPDDSITLIYDKQLLSEAAQEKLQVFCKTHRILALDIEDLKSDLANDQERALMAYAEAEIRHAKNNTGGNWGSPSDILRWLSSVYKLGVYSDFDIKINTADLPEMVQVNEPIISNIGTVIFPPQGKTSERKTVPLIIGDIVAVAEAIHHSSKAAELCTQKIDQIQQGILQNYQRRNFNLKTIRDKYLRGGDIFSLTGTEDLELFNGEDIFAIRCKVQEMYSSNRGFVMGNLQKILRLNPIAKLLVAQKIGCTFEEAVAAGTHEKEFQAIIVDNLKLIASMSGPIPDQSDEAFLTQARLQGEIIYYRMTVMGMSGSDAVAAAFYEGDLNKFHSCSLEAYELDANFKSGIQCKFGSPLESVAHLLTGAPTQHADVSWLQAGAEASKEREKKIDASARLIQMWSRKQLAKKHAAEDCREKELEYSPRYGSGS